MNFTLDQLEAFSASAETGSFSAAARKLGKAQSAVSMAISNLEIDLGLELFDRAGKYPVLTFTGEMFLREAETILSPFAGPCKPKRRRGRNHGKPGSVCGFGIPPEHSL